MNEMLREMLRHQIARAEESTRGFLGFKVDISRDETQRIIINGQKYTGATFADAFSSEEEFLDKFFEGKDLESKKKDSIKRIVNRYFQQEGLLEMDREAIMMTLMNPGAPDDELENKYNMRWANGGVFDISLDDDGNIRIKKETEINGIFSYSGEVDVAEDVATLYSEYVIKVPDEPSTNITKSDLEIVRYDLNPVEGLEGERKKVYDKIQSTLLTLTSTEGADSPGQKTLDFCAEKERELLVARAERKAVVTQLKDLIIEKQEYGGKRPVRAANESTYTMFADLARGKSLVVNGKSVFPQREEEQAGFGRSDIKRMELKENADKFWELLFTGKDFTDEKKEAIKVQMLNYLHQGALLFSANMAISDMATISGYNFDIKLDNLGFSWDGDNLVIETNSTLKDPLSFSDPKTDLPLAANYDAKYKISFGDKPTDIPSLKVDSLNISSIKSYYSSDFAEACQDINQNILKIGDYILYKSDLRQSFIDALNIGVIKYSDDPMNELKRLFEEVEELCAAIRSSPDGPSLEESILEARSEIMHKMQKELVANIERDINLKEIEDFENFYHKYTDVREKLVEKARQLSESAERVNLEGIAASAIDTAEIHLQESASSILDRKVKEALKEDDANSRILAIKNKAVSSSIIKEEDFNKLLETRISRYLSSSNTACVMADKIARVQKNFCESFGLSRVVSEFHSLRKDKSESEIHCELSTQSGVGFSQSSNMQEKGLILSAYEKNKNSNKWWKTAFTRKSNRKKQISDLDSALSSLVSSNPEEYAYKLEKFHEQVSLTLNEINKENNLAKSRLGEICETLLEALEKVEPMLKEKASNNTPERTRTDHHIQ